MSISSINGVARLSTATAESSAAVTATARQVSADASVPLDEVTQQPLPPRFPWLSRLSLQLEAASQQRPAFGTAPPLGDHVDQSA